MEQILIQLVAEKLPRVTVPLVIFLPILHTNKKMATGTVPVAIFLFVWRTGTNITKGTDTRGNFGATS